MVHSLCAGGLPGGGGGQTGSPVPAEGRPGGPGVSQGVGTGSPIRGRHVSPGTPMSSSHPEWDPDTQSMGQLGPEPRSDLAPCRLGLPAPPCPGWARQGSGQGVERVGVGRGPLQHPVWRSGCFLSWALVIVLVWRVSLSPWGQVAGGWPSTLAFRPICVRDCPGRGAGGPRVAAGMLCGPNTQHDLTESTPSGPPPLIFQGGGGLARPPRGSGDGLAGGRSGYTLVAVAGPPGPVAPSCHLWVLGAGRVLIRNAERALLAPPGMSVGLVRAFGG